MACRPGWSLMVVVWFVRPIHGRNTRNLRHCHEAFLSSFYELLVARGASRKVTGIAVLVDLVYLTTTSQQQLLLKSLKGSHFLNINYLMFQKYNHNLSGITGQW